MKAKIIINGIEKEIELTSEQAKELGLIKYYKPKRQQQYYFLSDCGHETEAKWEDGISDIIRYDMGNCYETKSEAQFERLCQFYTAHYKRWLQEPIDWADRTQAKWYAYYDYASNKIDFNHTFVCKKQGTLYSTSKDIIENFIEEIGANNFKTYILRVEN